MLNKVVLVGRLTRDPGAELRYTQSGTAVCKMTLAVDRPKFGDREKETDYIDVVAWSKLGELCANNLQKGRLIAVTGRLQIRSYDDKEGVKRKVAEVVAEEVKFLDWPKDNGQREPGMEPPEIGFNSDDVPF